MNIDDKTIPYFPSLIHKALVYDYYVNDIVKINYVEADQSESVSKMTNCGKDCEKYCITKMKKANDEEKEYFFSNLRKIYIRNHNIMDILETISDDEFKTIPKWIEQYKHFSKYLIYFDYGKNINNHYNNCYYNSNEIKLYEVKYYKKFSKIDNILIPEHHPTQKILGQTIKVNGHYNHSKYNKKQVYDFETVYDSENLVYRYFVLFKKFLIENSKLPKELCTITISQKEYENLIKLKSESSVFATISDS